MEANPTVHEVDTLIFVTPGAAALATDARGLSCMSVIFAPLGWLCRARATESWHFQPTHFN